MIVSCSTSKAAISSGWESKAETLGSQHPIAILISLCESPGQVTDWHKSLTAFTDRPLTEQGGRIYRMIETSAQPDLSFSLYCPTPTPRDASQTQLEGWISNTPAKSSVQLLFRDKDALEDVASTFSHIFADLTGWINCCGISGPGTMLCSHVSLAPWL